MSRSFNLTDIEENLWKKWLKDHNCKGFVQELDFCNVANYSINFSPSMVGDVVRLHCNLCGEELDITDYDSF